MQIDQSIISKNVGAMAMWTIIIFLSLLLSHNAILYFTHGGEYGILPEKILARQDIVWNVCFYAHLPSGILCLIMPWISFGRKVFRSQSIHTVVGKAYAVITLFIVCPTGLYLALYARGGIITQIGFALQGILLMYFTYEGYTTIRSGNRGEHVASMIRSYSIATVVLTFRVLHIIFFLLNVPYHHNYPISQWLGLSLNMLFAELIIASTCKRNFSPIKKQSHEFD